MSLSLRITTLTATALITAATFAGGTVALASASAVPRPQSRIALNTIEGRSTGFGATLAAAERDAKGELLMYGAVASDPVISPDGRLVAYVVTATSGDEGRASALWVVPADASAPP